MIESLYLVEKSTDAHASEPTADDLVARAAALRERLRDAQDEHTVLGGYSKKFHDEFVAAGFYRVLQPKRFGGLELGLEAFVRVGIEISRGDPAVGWSYVTGSGHILQLASFFGERAQEEVFSGDYCVAPARTAPTGKATKVDGGWRLSGRWEYCSGSKWSTWIAVCAQAVDGDTVSAAPNLYLVPRSDYTILDDWGGDSIMGMQASSSNTITIDDVFVPEHRAVPYAFRDHELGELGPIGYQINGNPLYVGRQMTPFNTELAITQVGAAWASVDEIESLMEDKMTGFPPRTPRRESPEYLYWFGRMRALADSAEVLLIGGVGRYEALAAHWAGTGEEFTAHQDARIRAVVQQAAQLADECVDLAFTTSGTTSAKKGMRLGKYFRDVSVYRTHVAAQYDVTYSSAARYHFGQPLTL